MTEVQEAKQQRLLFRGQFEGEAGNDLLAWFLNECGCWSMDPALINPDMVALGNRLLAHIGILHPGNLRVIAARLMEAATDEDLQEEE